MAKIRLFRASMLSAALLFSTLTFGQSDLIITAVFDATLTGGTPKGAEIYVLNDVADLSIYGIGSANNGGGTDGEEFTFPAVSATAGDFIYVSSEAPQFLAFFGFDSDYVSVALAVNGDDAVELFQNGLVVDVFGDINVDGSGQAWEYTDSWAYRANGSSPSATFSTGDWLIPGPDALDGETTNDSAAQPIPTGTFDPEGGSTCADPFPAVDEESLSTTLVGNAYLVEWDAVEGQIGCQLQLRSVAGEGIAKTTILGEDISSTEIPGYLLDFSTEYEWRVRCGCSVDPLVAGPYSSWQQFTTPGSAISSLPNPTEGQSNVTFTVVEEGYTTLEVFDMSGRLVDAIFTGVAQPNNEYRFEFDGSALPNGVYIYRLTTENEVINDKFMIAK